jgi:hypothetical protein
MRKKRKKILKSILKKREKRKFKREEKIKLEEWKTKVKMRDNYTCQVCKHQSGNLVLNAHHILPNIKKSKKYEVFKFDLNNGITLCVHCHKWSADSAHQNAIFFYNWLRKYRHPQLEYLEKALNKVLVVDTSFKEFEKSFMDETDDKDIEVKARIE